MTPGTARCPVCHRRHLLAVDGTFAIHHVTTQPGSTICSGTGQPGPELAKQKAIDQARLAQERALVMSLVSFLLVVDNTVGTIAEPGPEHEGHGQVELEWKEYPFIKWARAALFEATQARPELLDGTNLAVLPYEHTSPASRLFEGPRS